MHTVFADRSSLRTEELRYLDNATLWQCSERAYIALLPTKLHTLAPDLADSPAGLAAWLVEKLRSWPDATLSECDILT